MKPYPKYKPSGIEWIGEIPEHWSIKKGKYLFNFLNGYPFDSKNFSYNPDVGLQIVRIRDINKHYSETYWDGSIVEEALINKGDILIGMDGDFNVSKWKGGQALLNQRVCRIYGKNELDDFYLFYLLPFSLKVINDLTYYTTVKHLSNDDLWLESFPVPPPAEQTAIANYLDRKTAQIDDLIDKKQRLIELLNEEKTALINQAVTKGLNPDAPMKDSGIPWLGEIPAHWEVKKLKYIAQNVQTGNTPPSNNAEYYSQEIDWFTPVDFDENLFLRDSKRKISKLAIEEGVAKLFPRNTVLLVGIGATLGKVGLLDKPSSSNQQINAIIFNSNLFAKYCLYFLFVNQKNIVSLSNAATLAILNQTQTKNIMLPLPSEKEIEGIVKHIEDFTLRITHTINKLEKEIDLFREYRTALISEAVTGKIDVRPACAAAAAGREEAI